MDKLTELFGKLFLIFFTYAISILVGLYKAFIVNKAVVYFLPQYTTLLTTIQIWAIIMIYNLVTFKIDNEDNKDTDTIIKTMFTRLLNRFAVLSLMWLGLYIVKSFI
jgi:hypothetical protein